MNKRSATLLLGPLVLNGHIIGGVRSGFRSGEVAGVAAAMELSEL